MMSLVLVAGLLVALYALNCSNKEIDRLQNDALKSGDEWRNAAMRIGERLSPNGPEDYYKFTADQWLKWAEDLAIEKELLK